jgi:hypothetical protein
MSSAFCLILRLNYGNFNFSSSENGGERCGGLWENKM